MKAVRQAWVDMKRRCDNPEAANYSDYGGRGITYCPAWADFTAFFKDMGMRPAGRSLDRIDNNGNYEPDNCRWATSQEQNLNRRRLKLETTLRCNNRSGIVGVCFDEQKNKWVVKGNQDRKTKTLYCGPDFLEACCARKSWETKERLQS